MSSRRITLRGCLVGFALFIGLCMPVQAVFACGVMDGKVSVSVVCCCEPASTLTCETGGTCQDHAVDWLTLAASCCEVFFVPAPGSMAMTLGLPARPAWQLTPPQAPPLPPAYLFQASPTRSQVLGFNHFGAILSPATKAYLLNRRLRI